jgi:hypothetical protein
MNHWPTIVNYVLNVAGASLHCTAAATPLSLYRYEAQSNSLCAFNHPHALTEKTSLKADKEDSGWGMGVLNNRLNNQIHCRIINRLNDRINDRINIRINNQTHDLIMSRMLFTFN